MAIRACRECGKDVSTEAVNCPHCGARKPIGLTSEPESSAEGPAPGPRKTYRWWPVLVIVGLVVVWALMQMAPSKTGTAITTAAQPERHMLAPLVGRDCTLTDTALMSAGPGTARKSARAVAKIDKPTLTAPLAARRAVPITGGQQARVMDVDWTVQAP
jgi:hypothetical protein